MVRKEDVLLLAQLFHSMKNLARGLEKAQKAKNTAWISRSKKELLDLQKKVDKILG